MKQFIKIKVYGLVRIKKRKGKNPLRLRVFAFTINLKTNSVSCYEPHPTR